MRVKAILTAMLLTVMMSCGVRIPQSATRAKKVVERNTRQTELIVDYHNLKNPFVYQDTLEVRVPSFEGRRTFKDSVRFDNIVDKAFDIYVLPSVKDGVDVANIKDDLVENLRQKVDYTYSDSLVSISVSGFADSLTVDYQIKERDIKSPVEYEKYDIDTSVEWYEDRFVRISVALLLLIFLGWLIVPAIYRRSPD